MIESKLLQALAYSMRSNKGEKGEGAEEEAFTILEEAVRLGEGEGFIRRFVDEGPRMAQLLSQLRARGRRSEAPLFEDRILYIDRLLAAFEGAGQSTLTSRKLPLPVQARGHNTAGDGPHSGRAVERAGA